MRTLIKTPTKLKDFLLLRIGFQRKENKCLSIIIIYKAKFTISKTVVHIIIINSTVYFK